MRKTLTLAGGMALAALAAVSGAHADEGAEPIITETETWFGGEQFTSEPDAPGTVADALNEYEFVNADAIQGDIDEYFDYVDYDGGDSSDVAAALADGLDAADVANASVTGSDVADAMHDAGIEFDVSQPSFWQDMFAHLVNNDVEYDGSEPYITDDSIAAALDGTWLPEDGAVTGGDLEDVATQLNAQLAGEDIASGDVTSGDVSDALDADGLGVEGPTQTQTEFLDGFVYVDDPAELVTPFGDFALPDGVADIVETFIDPSDLLG